MGSVIWRPILDPATPGRFVSSQIVGGRVLSIQAANQGARTATWTATGLQAGYYKIEVLYPKHADNATRIIVLTKATLDSGFKARPKRLNQQIGDGDTSVTRRFVNTSTNVTPYSVSNAASYVWVSNNTTSDPYTGKLAVQLNDNGCPAGRICADAIRLTLISTTK